MVCTWLPSPRACFFFIYSSLFADVKASNCAGCQSTSTICWEDEWAPAWGANCTESVRQHDLPVISGPKSAENKILDSDCPWRNCHHPLTSDRDPSFWHCTPELVGSLQNFTTLCTRPRHGVPQNMSWQEETQWCLHLFQRTWRSIFKKICTSFDKVSFVVLKHWFMFMNYQLSASISDDLL